MKVPCSGESSSLGYSRRGAAAGRHSDAASQPRWPGTANATRPRGSADRPGLLETAPGVETPPPGDPFDQYDYRRAVRHGGIAVSCQQCPLSRPRPGTIATYRPPPDERSAAESMPGPTRVDRSRCSAVSRAHRGIARPSGRNRRSRPERARSRGMARGHAPRRAAGARPARARRSLHRSGHAGGGEPGRDARLSDRLGARPLDRQFGAAGGDALVRRAGGRDQADLRLFLPRHERQSACAHFRARLRQCARHRRVHAGRRPHASPSRTAGAACRRSRAFCATCRPRPASNSPPCWRRAPTSFTTITSTSI